MKVGGVVGGLCFMGSCFGCVDLIVDDSNEVVRVSDFHC